MFLYRDDQFMIDMHSHQDVPCDSYKLLMITISLVGAVFFEIPEKESRQMITFSKISILNKTNSSILIKLHMDPPT